MPRLLIATNNQGKLAEYEALLDGCGWEIVSPADLGLDLSVEETGDDYATNARLKAEAYACASGVLTLADDSGIEIDALDGRPGPFSARYAGPNQTDEEGVELVLSEMNNVPAEDRDARFRCVIVLARPDGAGQIVEGECPGLITNGPRGSNGFGYDPIFYLPELGKTMAELNFDEKNKISHRSRAAKKACGLLKAMARESFDA
jgi:XTP/dITP diphosphohydrolase